ncbi:MAG: BREX-1 system adenine-specific DNA-methyltransferase PglX [Isosphaeraceae bacterium]
MSDLSQIPTGQGIYIRLLARDDKPAALADAVQRLRDGQSCPDTYAVEPESFRQVPGAPFAYWVSDGIRKLFSVLSPAEGDGRELRVGGQTSDDFCYLRLFWETPSTSDHTWKTYQKGGDYSVFYSDVPLVADWDIKRQTYRGFYGRIGRTNEHPSSYQYYFRYGLTWSRRSQRGLSMRVLPVESIFSDKGPSIFTSKASLWPLLGLTNSKPFHELVLLQMAFGSYEVGAIQRTPVPDLTRSEGARLGDLARSAVELKRSLDTAVEISHVFQLPALLQVPGGTLAERLAAWQAREADAERQLAEIQREVDDIAFRLYGIDGEDRRAIEAGASARPPADGEDEASVEDEESDAQTATDARSLVAALVSYSLGAVFGRWDLRYATGERTPPELPDPFDPLPVCSPGMLQGPDGLPLTSPPEGYPLPIDADGMLVDDPDHPDDIIRRVREVLELIWKDRADAIEREACDLLGVADLRDYFRKPGKGGFWDDHIARYSKSRRKAPIYWLLQSSKKNYGLWLYYHRIDKDILFKALLNYVEPKIRKEDARLGELRSQKAALGPAAKGSKKLDKDIDRQEAFLSELRDFEDRLRRAANLHLVPDLNDGVVLNIAPLRELVPWKEARSYWDDLMDGQYEWSSIGKQLREKGLVK